MLKKILIGVLFVLAPVLSKAATQQYVASTTTYQNYQINIGTITAKSLTISSTVTIPSSSIISIASGTINTLTASTQTINDSLTVATGSTVTLNGINNIAGRTTGSYPASGFVGAYLSTATGEVINGVNGQYGDIVSMSIPAGNWLLIGSCDAAQNGATITDESCGIGTASGNNNTGTVSGQNYGNVPNATSNINSYGMFRQYISQSNSNTYYLKHHSDFTGGPIKFSGQLTAQMLH